MDKNIEAFRDEVTRWRGTRRKGARPYTAEMKAKALQLAQGLRKRGVPMAVVGERLGVCAATLYLWQGSSKRGRMMRVKVVGQVPTAAPAVVDLVSPRGYRLPGLPVKVAMAMLQELG
jgi:hypothetical protein